MSAFNIIKSDDGLSYRIEWDVHYITDEQIGTIVAYVGALQEENEKLRSKLEERLTDEEVVRCRDCKWCMAYSNATYCDRFAHGLPTVELDGFCAWGERCKA